MEQRKARNWPKVVIGALCVVLLVGVAFRLIQESAVDKELEAFQAKYRALGYPVTLEELKERHEVPEGEENAAPLILAALDRIDDSDVDYDYIPIFLGNYDEDVKPWERLPTEVASESQYFLSINEEVLSELRKLIRKPYCYFPIDWDDIVNEDFGRLAKMRQLARIFALQSWVLGEAGEIDGAIDSIESIFVLGDIEQRQPAYIAYLVGTAIHSIGTASSKWLLESSDLSDEQLMRLDAIVRSAKSREDVLPSLLGDHILWQRWIELNREIAPFVLKFTTPDPIGRIMDDIYVMAGLDAHDARAYLQSFDDYLELLRLPVSEALDRDATLDTPFFFSLFPTGMMRESQMIVSAVGVLPFLVHQIRYDTILTTLQVERYRLQEGALPNSLEELVPEYLDKVPEDPYGEGPLRFRAVGESYVVYSVGSNRVDDGGYDFEADKAIRPMKEIAFVVRRPGGGAP